MRAMAPTWAPALGEKRQAMRFCLVTSLQIEGNLKKYLHLSTIYDEM
jgi:hypothetical protein